MFRPPLHWLNRIGIPLLLELIFSSQLLAHSLPPSQNSDINLPIYLPLISNSPHREHQYDSGKVLRCDPNAGMTYVQGTIGRAGQGINGAIIVFSYEPDGEIVASTVSHTLGNQAGHFAHTLSTQGAREGDWYFWVTDEYQRRISVLTYLHTDGEVWERSCQQAFIKITDSQPGEYQFKSGKVLRCDPNAGMTYIKGTIERAGQGVNGEIIALSNEPDGKIVATTFSHTLEDRAGQFVYTLNPQGPREGDWYLWVVDQYQRRISVLTYLYTDGEAWERSCQQAIIKFSDQ